MIGQKATQLTFYNLMSIMLYVTLIRGTHGGVIQAYSWLSTTHSHITDCKLNSVVYAGVCVVI